MPEDTSTPITFQGFENSSLQLPVAQALARVQATLLPDGLSLYVHTAYLTWAALQQRHADAAESLRQFALDPTDPADCALSRGTAVEVQLARIGALCDSSATQKKRNSAPPNSAELLPM